MALRSAIPREGAIIFHDLLFPVDLTPNLSSILRLPIRDQVDKDRNVPKPDSCSAEILSAAIALQGQEHLLYVTFAMASLQRSNVRGSYYSQIGYNSEWYHDLSPRNSVSYGASLRYGN